jgi:uncharacterized membrane protein
MNIRMVTRGAVIAAMYVVLTVSPGLNSISFYQVQFRISEMLMPLAFFELAAVPGLWIGCIIANLIGSPFGVLDITLGAGLTLLAAAFMYKMGPRWEGLAIPVLVNAFGVAVVLSFAGGFPYWPSVLWVGLGEAGVMVVLGAPLYAMLRGNPSLLGLEERLR